MNCAVRGPSARTRIASAFVITMLLSGCSHGNPLGPPIPTGATVLGGAPMTSGPPPPPGWKLQPVIPTSQQQAQGTVLGYLKKTLQALPAGTTLDASRYGGAGHDSYCDDNATSPSSPQRFHTLGDLAFPAGADFDAMIAKTGDVWKSWGWYVIERDGFDKPNRFGYAPDGYSLQIESRYRPGYPPSLVGMSPCFSGDLARDDIPIPTVIRAD